MTDTIREELEAAYQASMKTDEEPVEEPTESSDAGELEPELDAAEPVEASGEEAPAQSERRSGEQVTLEQASGRDPQGRFAKKAAPAVTVKPTPSAQAAAQKGKTPLPEAPKVPGAVPPAEVKPAAAAPTELRPPASLKAAEREAFKAWPRAAQEAFIRREAEAATKIASQAQPAKFGQALQQVLAPHAPVLQAMGGDPLRAVDSLLHTARALHHGTAAERADAVASILGAFNVDVDLVNERLQRPGSAPGNPAAPSMDPRALQQMLRQQGFVTREELEQAQVQRREQQAQREIDTFAEKAEFWPDVEHLIAPILRSSKAREARGGSPMTLQQAYDVACRADPDVAAVLEQRSRHQQANAANASTQRAKNAGATIRSGSPGPAPEARPQATDDIRADLEAAMAAVSRR
jgi:hypothetical protein